MLKEEINRLRKELEKEPPISKESLQGSGGEQSSLHDIILEKEKALEMLINDLNDKVRFGQKATERPGSGAGRVAGYSDRPPSQSGSIDESRSAELVDRPRSRGMADGWRRPADDRRAFQGGRERGFLGNRDLDRYIFGKKLPVLTFTNELLCKKEKDMRILLRIIFCWK